MSETSTPAGAHVEKVGGFDIRNFIGLLIGLYGLVLAIWGLFFFDDFESGKTGGVNANLYAGIAMLVFGAVFIAWARLKPLRIVVSDNEPGAEQPRDIAPLD